MIKATGGTKDGTPLLLLGLSRANTEKLLAGQPIPIRTTDVDPRHPDMHILLMAGETEDILAEQLKVLER
mgnify:FL=1